MFIGVTFQNSELDSVNNAIDFHLSKLQKTNYVGYIVRKRIGKFDFYVDSESSHFIESETEDSLLYFGGYCSEKNVWVSGRHSSETELAWGEWAAYKFTKLQSGANEWILKIYNGPTGSWPLYYGSKNGRTAISNDPIFVAVAIGEYELDLWSSLELLFYSHTINDLTTIKNVYKLKHNMYLEVKSNNDDKLRMFLMPKIVQFAYTNKRSSIEDAFNSLRNDISNYHNIEALLHDATIQISGGMDSRLTLFIITEISKSRPKCQTLDLSNEAEMQIASRVAESLGFQHQKVKLDEVPMDLKLIEDSWLLTGGQVSIHAAAGNLISYSAANGNPKSKQVVIGAWPGDCLIGSYVPNTIFMKYPIFANMAIGKWSRLRGYSVERLGLYCNKDVKLRKLVEIIDMNLLSNIKSCSGRSAAQKVSYWAMFRRQPAFSYIAPSNLTSNILQITPLLSGNYLRELMNLSANDLIQKNFYRKLFKKYLADINSISSTSYSDLNKRVRYHFIPRNLKEALFLLPTKFDKAILNVFHSLVRKEFIADKSMIKKSTEYSIWTSIFRDQNYSPELYIDGIKLSHRKSFLHTESVFHTLRLTQLHLNHAANQTITSQSDNGHPPK